MKKLVLKLCVAASTILSCLAANAQWVPPFEMKYIPGFVKDYPVVTNNFDMLFLQPLNNENYWLGLYRAIIKINGQSTKNKSIEEINGMMMQADTLRLQVAFDIHREHCRYTNLTFVQSNNKNGYGDIPQVLEKYLEEKKKIDKVNNDENGLDGIRVLADKDIRFSDIATYDLLITGDDPLADKKILEKFCESHFFAGLKRDEENPDILVCLARDAKESISATYVPPTSTIVNTGSETKPVYNYLTRSTTFVTTQKNQTVTTDGYTKISTATSIYIEFSILDAKKMNDPAQKTAPVIWKMTYSRNVADRNFELLDEYLAVASWNPFPFDYYPYIEVPKWHVGCTFDGNVVSSNVIPGSAAANLGLQKGDVLLKLNKKNVVWYSFSFSYDTKMQSVEDNINELSGVLLFAAKVMAGKINGKKEIDDKQYAFAAGRYEFSRGNNWLIVRNGEKLKLFGPLFPDPKLLYMGYTYHSDNTYWIAR